MMEDQWTIDLPSNTLRNAKLSAQLIRIAQDYEYPPLPYGAIGVSCPLEDLSVAYGQQLIGQLPTIWRALPGITPHLRVSYPSFLGGSRRYVAWYDPAFEKVLVHEFVPLPVVRLEDGLSQRPATPPEVADRRHGYDPSEQDVVLRTFSEMLAHVTRDGGKKRARGEKPPWWIDPAHEAAIFSHLSKWKHGEKVDPDSGAHPLVHLAWRALAVAYQEATGKTAPV